MEVLDLHATEFTPKILFDHQNNLFEISGYSRPEDVFEFFDKVHDWIDTFEEKILIPAEYKLFQDPPLTLTFHMRYYNSASSKCFLDILYRFLEFTSKGINFKIYWCYDEGDETILEAGEELSDLIEFPFEYFDKG